MNDFQDRTLLLRSELTKEYKKFVHKDILNEYCLPERRILANSGDRDLYPISLELPEPPPYHLIDGFGLQKKDQYFKTPVIPTKLTDLIKRLGKNASIIDIWNALDLNRTYYASVIYWINMQWFLRKNGYWFFNNGLPTFIDGWHWMYLSWWNLDIGLPEYRYRDKIFFLFSKYCYTTTQAPFFFRVYDDQEYTYFYSKAQADKYISDKGLLCRAEKGEYLVDMGRRTIFGFNYPKHRREGATYKAAMINYEIVSSNKSAHGAIQSKDEKSAKKDVYKNAIITPFKKLPFFFKPQYSNSYTVELEFDTFSTASGNGGYAGSTSGLESIISYRSAGDRQYDGSKNKCVHGDEIGKPGDYNSILRHNVIKKTVSQGSNINGLLLYTSTVSDTAGDAGRNFMYLCKSSKWEKRSSKSGRTDSGLVSLFIPATFNYDGFTDRYGNPIIIKPTPEQRKYINNKHGALGYLEEQLEAASGDMISYYETMREFPMEFKHCFLSPGKDSGFNLKVLSDRMSELDMSDDLTPIRHNFAWVDKFGGDVKIVLKPADGRFYTSYTPATVNKHTMEDGKRRPGNTNLFVASADPFKFENTKGGKKSNGGGCVYLKHDLFVDPMEKDVSQYETNRAVCSYNNRVDYKKSYCEDMLMMCIYNGTKIFPENNENAIYEYFKLHGFEKYLQYKVIDGIQDPNPGFTSTVEEKQRLFSLIMDHIDKYGKAERHRDILQEIYDIRGLEDMTNYDLFTAYGGCFLAIYYDEKTRPTQTFEEGEIDPMAKYLLGQY